MSTTHSFQCFHSEMRSEIYYALVTGCENTYLTSDRSRVIYGPLTDVFLFALRHVSFHELYSRGVMFEVWDSWEPENQPYDCVAGLFCSPSVHMRYPRPFHELDRSVLRIMILEACRRGLMEAPLVPCELQTRSMWQLLLPRDDYTFSPETVALELQRDEAFMRELRERHEHLRPLSKER